MNLLNPLDPGDLWEDAVVEPVAEVSIGAIFFDEDEEYRALVEELER